MNMVENKVNAKNKEKSCSECESYNLVKGFYCNDGGDILDVTLTTKANECDYYVEMTPEEARAKKDDSIKALGEMMNTVEEYRRDAELMEQDITRLMTDLIEDEDDACLLCQARHGGKPINKCDVCGLG